MEPNYYDVLIYRDLSDPHTGPPPRVGDSAERFGFGDLQVVAVGPGIHSGRTTMVLSGVDAPRFQQWLEGRSPAASPSSAPTTSEEAVLQTDLRRQTRG
jgi:hypothetical protein